MKRRCIGCLLLFFLFFQAAPALGGDRVAVKNRATLSLEYDDNVYKASSDVEGDFLGRLYYDFRMNLYPTFNNISW